MFTRFMAVIALVCLAPVAGLADAAARQVVVTGVGTTVSEPDMATITLGVTHEDREAKRAMNRVSDDVRALLKRLADFGLEARSVQTSTLRLDPVWNHGDRSQSGGRPGIVGFVARNELTVKLHDFARLGELLDLLLEDGANQFSGVQFGVKTPEPLYDEARKKAMADAARKAALYTDAAGATLGPVLEIREPGSMVDSSPRMARMEIADAGMPVAGGELTFSASVTVIYEITD